MSLEKGIVPENWKVALVNPLLKKLGMDLVFENFRPVNNLHFLTKVAEKVVTSQLVNHCNENAPLPVNQSAYRQLHSTETALLKVQNDILINMDNEEVTLLVMLDMSAAFDTIDHNILIDILKNDFGVVDSALQWFISYLANRKQQVVIDRCKSSEFMVATGVPQGSCLGPVLFLLYVSGLSGIISKHLPCHHAFADDTQLYLSFKPQNSLHQESAVKAMEDCIDELRNWMTAHRLFIQSSKTEFIIIGSRQQLSKVSIDKLRVGEVLISPVSAVRDLGSWLDIHMAMNMHVSKICSKAFRSLYHIKQIRKYLTDDATKILVHAFITSHLDYCNSLLYGIPKYQLNRLQKVLNAAARVVCLVPKFDHITPTLMRLHWLPVKYRVIFKIVLLVYKALHGLAPKYICDMLTYKRSNNYSLRSDELGLLHGPSTRRKSFGDRAFLKAGPTLWNLVPCEIRLSPSLDSFKTNLKTFLYRDAYINNTSCF